MAIFNQRFDRNLLQKTNKECSTCKKKKKNINF